MKGCEYDCWYYWNETFCVVSWKALILVPSSLRLLLSVPTMLRHYFQDVEFRNVKIYIFLVFFDKLYLFEIFKSQAFFWIIFRFFSLLLLMLIHQDMLPCFWHFCFCMTSWGAGGWGGGIPLVGVTIICMTSGSHNQWEFVFPTT